MYWQEKDELKPIKVRTPTGEFYLKGFADGFHGRLRAKQPTRRARVAYNKGFEAGVDMQQKVRESNAVTFKDDHSMGLTG